MPDAKIPYPSFVQITDMHVRAPGRLAYGRLDTAPYLKKTVDSILALPQRPLAVVVTGDLVDAGQVEEYEHLRELLSPLTMPVYLMPGNHDDRDNLRRVFADHVYMGEDDFIQYRCQIGPVHLVALDTLRPGHSAGMLCTRRLAWLEQQLADLHEEPVVIAMHHPPFRTLIRHMDDAGLTEGAIELEAMLRRHVNVERVICGHLHRAIEVRYAGTLATTCPAPAHQITLDMDPKASLTWTLEPPAFRVHVWDDVAGRVITHLAPAGRFDGPHPFRG